LASLKQIDNDRMSFIAKVQSAVEELKMLLEVDSINEIKKLDKFYMITILSVMNPNFYHVRDQILNGQEVPYIASLTTRLLHVPTLKSRNIQESVESFAMVSTQGRGTHSIKGERGGRSLQCTYCKRMGHTRENYYS